VEDMDHAKLKNKADKPKKRVTAKTGPELSSEEELWHNLALLGAVKNK
jgi:hypothetical protein